MSRSTVTVTIYPQVDGFVRAMSRLVRSALHAERRMKDLRRKHRIAAKQARRDQSRANRRPALIHNGRKPR